MGEKFLSTPGIRTLRQRRAGPTLYQLSYIPTHPKNYLTRNTQSASTATSRRSTVDQISSKSLSQYSLRVTLYWKGTRGKVYTWTVKADKLLRKNLMAAVEAWRTTSFKWNNLIWFGLLNSRDFFFPALAVLHCTPRYPTVPHSTTGYPTVPNGTPLYPTLPHCTPRYPIVPHGTPLYPTVPRCIPWYPTVPHGTPLYPTVPHGTPLSVEALVLLFERTIEKKRRRRRRKNNVDVDILVLPFIS